MIRRRDLMTMLGGAALTWPFVASAQGDPMRRIGILLPDDPDLQAQLAVFRQALGTLGWIEGKTIAIDVRWSIGNAAEIVTNVAEIVGLRPDVIVAYSTSTLVPAQKKTHSIPIVFLSVTDPLAQGIVTSLARPDGNATGFSNPPFSIVGKSLELLKEVAPSVSRVAVMFSAVNGAAGGYVHSAETLAKQVSITPAVATFSDRDDVAREIEAFAQQPNGGLFFPRDTATNAYRDTIVALAAQHRLPAIYAQREIVAGGGLMSYGVELGDAWRGAADYTDRLLRGAKPGDLPVQEPTRYQFVVNLKTAKALGLNVPLSLQMSADQVIE